MAAVATAGLLVAGAAAGPADAAFLRATVSPASAMNSAGSFYPYRTAVPADSPHLYWRLEEGSGAAVDDSGSGNRDGALGARPREADRQLYLDGVLQGSGTASPVSLPTAYWRAGAEQMSGWTGDPTSSWLVGDLDELAVYTTVLSPARVAAHHAAGATAP